MLRLLFPEWKEKIEAGEKQIAGVPNISHQPEGIQFKR